MAARWPRHQAKKLRIARARARGLRTKNDGREGRKNNKRGGCASQLNFIPYLFAEKKGCCSFSLFGDFL